MSMHLFLLSGCTVWRLGLGLVISRERVIWGFNESIRFLQDGHLFGVPMPFVIVAGSYLLFYYLLRYTKFGTSIYAVGGNKNAAVLAGIPIKINVALTYGLSGLMAGAAGIMMVARNEFLSGYNRNRVSV